MMLSEYSGDPVTVFFRDVSCLLAFGNAWVQDTLSPKHSYNKAPKSRSECWLRQNQNGTVETGSTISKEVQFVYTIHSRHPEPRFWTLPAVRSMAARSYRRDTSWKDR